MEGGRGSAISLTFSPPVKSQTADTWTAVLEVRVWEFVQTDVCEGPSLTDAFLLPVDTGASNQI